METLELRNSSELRGVDEKKRIATFVASTELKDRHDSIIKQRGWELDKFNQNSIIGYQHNVYGGGMCDKATPDDVIGKGRAYLETVTKSVKGVPEEQERLMVDIEFKPEGRSELADKVFEDVRDGFLKSVSVGFIAHDKGFGRKDEDGTIHDPETLYITRQELLEVSIVNIPSNSDAVKRSFRDSTAGAMKFLRELTGFTYGELEELQLKDILDILDGKKVEKEIKPEAAPSDLEEKVSDEQIQEVDSFIDLKEKELHLKS